MEEIKSKTINIKRGDIVWLKPNIDYHNIGGSVQDINRPYIVISNDINNTKANIVNLACISKQIRKSKYPMHVYLDKNKYNLKYNSVAFMEQISTVPKDFINEKIGSLDEDDIKKLNKAIITQMIGININNLEEMIN